MVLLAWTEREKMAVLIVGLPKAETEMKRRCDKTRRFGFIVLGLMVLGLAPFVKRDTRWNFCAKIKAMVSDG